LATKPSCQTVEADGLFEEQLLIDGMVPYRGITRRAEAICRTPQSHDELHCI